MARLIGSPEHFPTVMKRAVCPLFPQARDQDPAEKERRHLLSQREEWLWKVWRTTSGPFLAPVSPQGESVSDWTLAHSR